MAEIATITWQLDQVIVERALFLVDRAGEAFARRQRDRDSIHAVFRGTRLFLELFDQLADARVICLNPCMLGFDVFQGDCGHLMLLQR